MSKRFLAVLSPHKFTPTIISDDIDFNQSWKSNQAWVLSNLAHIAYFNKIKIKEFLKKLGTTNVFYYDYAGAQAFLAIWDDKAVLSFRGTQPVEHPTKKKSKLSFFRRLVIKALIKLPINPFSLLFLNNDILADLDFIQTDFDGTGKTHVHSGFLKEINKIWDNNKTEESVSSEILKDLKQHTSTLPLYVTGHSLGGAMATLAGMKYSFESVVTFGEPRVGRKIHLAFKSISHTRYVNGDDPVTKLPPKLFSYYKHHGQELKIQDSDNDSNVIYDHAIVYYSENLT